MLDEVQATIVTVLLEVDLDHLVASQLCTGQAFLDMDNSDKLIIFVPQDQHRVALLCAWHCVLLEQVLVQAEMQELLHQIKGIEA